MSGVVSIITNTMLTIDPNTFVVSVTEPARPPVHPPLGRVLAGFAAAGLATRLLETALGAAGRK
jgi:hypothetical protein